MAYEMFFVEAMRLLRPGGVLYICPLFVARTTFAYVALTGIYRRLSMPNLTAAGKLVYSDKVGQPYGLMIGPDWFKDHVLARINKYAHVQLVHYVNSQHAERGYSFQIGFRAIRNDTPFE
jgi:hypothetical protein